MISDQDFVQFFLSTVKKLFLQKTLHYTNSIRDKHFATKIIFRNIKHLRKKKEKYLNHAIFQ